MSKSWNVLVVDDEPDVHSVTRIALRRRTWKGRPIALTNAHSSQEARKILATDGCPLFHAALVDVVMESSDAGLQLCEFLRSNYPPSLRIVLRTGQANLAPEEAVLTKYDIDYYLAKTEVTEARLFGTLRACFRNSQDMLGAMALANHLRALTSALRDPRTTMQTLVEIMNKNLEFLEDKYNAQLTFVPAGGAGREAEAQAEKGGYLAVARAIAQAHQTRLATMTLHDGPPLGLSEGTSLVVTQGLESTDAASQTRIGRWFTSVVDKISRPKTIAGGGLAIRADAQWPAMMQQEFLLDLELFMTNWTLVEEVFTERSAESAKLGAGSW